MAGRVARGKIRVTSAHNQLNYCVIFVVFTQFVNVAADRLIQTDEAHVA
jgi:hypothetical protein